MSSGKTYKNAPISEVVLGITFTQPILSLVQILNIYSDSLREEYHSAEIAPVLATEVLQNGHLVSEPLTEGYGQAVYRFRSTEREPNWLIQLQRNKIYFHWVRDDDKPVGHYPGYTTIFTKYVELLHHVKNVVGQTLLMPSNIYQCELVYQDRFSMKNHALSPYDASTIFAVPLPKFLDGQREQMRSFISQFVSEYVSVNGYGISTIGIEPPANNDSTEILYVSHTLRGSITEQSSSSESVESWFQEAHTIQRTLFDNSFSQHTFEEWKS